MSQFTLRALRINLGLTLEEASTRIGVSKDTLSNYERGKSYPDVPIIKVIENEYQVSYDKINFLLEDNDKENDKDKEEVNK